jgi:hypothetical protein
MEQDRIAMPEKTAPSSSRKKRTKKAATPGRSITSSTTEPETGKKASVGRKPHECFNADNTPNDTSESIPLTTAQQTAILELLYRGASPAGACGQVGASVETFLKTVTDDGQFRAKVRDIAGVLSGNVMAVLYRTAMEGNVSAQGTWLKLFPPPTFSEPADDSPMTFDELLGDLSDDELVELARAVGVELPHEVEANLDAEGLSYLTEQISQRFAVDA